MTITVSTGVKVMVESLPRSESSLLSVKLGSLFLRDLTTQGTIFPVLVSPKTVSSDGRASHKNIEKVNCSSSNTQLIYFAVTCYRGTLLLLLTSHRASPALLLVRFLFCVNVNDELQLWSKVLWKQNKIIGLLSLWLGCVLNCAQMVGGRFQCVDICALPVD